MTALVSAFLRRNRPIHRLIRPFSSRIVTSGLPDVDVPPIAIPELILAEFRYDHLIATECGITGRRYTYGDIRKKSANLAKNLRKRVNLREGDVIGVLLPNVPEYSLAVLGALRAALVVTTLNPLYTPEEMARQLVDSSAKAVITLNEFAGIAAGFNKILKNPLPILAIRSQQSDSLAPQTLDFHELASTPLDVELPPPPPTTSTALMPYSSGTTGLPKGVCLTHRNIIANIRQNNAPEICFFRDTSPTHQDTVSAILPMFHIYGLTILSLIGLYKQVKSVTLPKFTPATYVAQLKTYKPTALFVVPPLVLFLTATPDLSRADFAPVHTVMSGAAPLGALDERRFLQKAGEHISILQGYGLTETSPVVTTTTRQMKVEHRDIDGTVGRALPNTELKVIDPEDASGAPLGPNKVGELLVKGPQVMKGYHNRAEETEKTFLDGWLRTGDMVYYNDDHFFFVTDRLKELIKVKGFQVPPAELEEIIRDFPGVEDAAVIGVPHPLHGEVPRAFIVVEKGAQVDAEALDRFVTSKVAEYKKLVGGITVIEAIPKNASGKILRRVLKMQYVNENK